MHPALRKGPLFYKKAPPLSTVLQKKTHFPFFFYKKNTPPISFPAYGPGLYLGEERLVEFEVLLLDVVEAVVAVGDEHDGERDELEQRAGVDDDAHKREDEHLDEAADALAEHDQHRVERGDAERRGAAVQDEVAHTRLPASQPRELRRRHRLTAAAPVAQPAARANTATVDNRLRPRSSAAPGESAPAREPAT